MSLSRRTVTTISTARRQRPHYQSPSPATSKRGADDKTLRADAKAVVGRWNEQLAAGRDMLWSPTIRAALLAGMPWLDMRGPSGLAVDGERPPTPKASLQPLRSPDSDRSSPVAASGEEAHRAAVSLGTAKPSQVSVRNSLLLIWLGRAPDGRKSPGDRAGALNGPMRGGRGMQLVRREQNNCGPLMFPQNPITKPCRPLPDGGRPCRAFAFWYDSARFSDVGAIASEFVCGQDIAPAAHQGMAIGFPANLSRQLVH